MFLLIFFPQYTTNKNNPCLQGSIHGCRGCRLWHPNVDWQDTPANQKHNGRLKTAPTSTPCVCTVGAACSRPLELMFCKTRLPVASVAGGRLPPLHFVWFVRVDWGGCWQNWRVVSRCAQGNKRTHRRYCN